MIMEAWSFDGMQAEVLSISKKGDGRQKVVKVVHNGNPLVIKFYGLKRGRIKTNIRRFLEGLAGIKSSFSASGRMQTERTVLQLWHREGFAVPALQHPDFLARISQPCLAMECISGKTLSAVLRSPETSLRRKKELVGGFAAAMGNRHARAIELQDCRLIPEHPSLKHILVADDRLVQFDFETVFTIKGDVERIVRYEVGSLLDSLAHQCREEFSILGRTFQTTYPEHKRLERVLNDLHKFGTIPVVGWLENFQIFFHLSKNHRRKALAARSFAGCFNMKKAHEKHATD